jgi:hypothetical protein
VRVSGTKIAGSIPNAFTTQQKLVELDLSNNGFTGQMPPIDALGEVETKAIVFLCDDVFLCITYFSVHVGHYSICFDLH